MDRRRIDRAQIVGALIGGLAGWALALWRPELTPSTFHLILWSAVAGSFLASWHGFAEAGARLLGPDEHPSLLSLAVALLVIAVLFALALVLAFLIATVLRHFA